VSFVAAIEQMIVDADRDGVATALVGATDEQRKALAPVLKKMVAQTNRWVSVQDEQGFTSYWQAYDAASLMLAGMGCLPTAAQVVAWLTRRPFAFTAPPADLTVTVLEARRVPWLADLANRFV
jgi:hypothetical protein